MAKAEHNTLTNWPDIDWGSWEILKEGTEAFILAMGPTLGYALSAARNLPNVGVVNARFIKPLDKKMLLELAEKAKVLLTVEEPRPSGVAWVQPF